MTLKAIGSFQDIKDYGTDNAVYVVTDSGINGTEEPKGQPSHPVDNIDDAIDIANNNDIKTIIVSTPDNTKITPTKPLDSFNVIGKGGVDYDKLHFNMNGVSHNGTFFENLVMEGDCSNAPFTLVNSCVLAMINSMSGSILAGKNCLVHNQGLQFDAIELWKSHTDNGLNVNEVPELDSDFVQLVGCEGQFILKNIKKSSMIPSYVRSYVSLTSGTIFIDDSCVDDSILIDGNVEVLGKKDSISDDYTLQGRNKGLDNINDNVRLNIEEGSVTEDWDGEGATIFELNYDYLYELNSIILNMENLTESGTWTLELDGITISDGYWDESEDGNTVVIKVGLIINEAVKLQWTPDNNDDNKEIEYSIRYRGDN